MSLIHGVMPTLLWFTVALFCVDARGTIYHVDSTRGNDANPGTAVHPWQTMGKVNESVPSLRPGDAVLFRRGCKWDGIRLDIRSIAGTEVQTITFGAYGPDTDPRPSIGQAAVAIFKSDHIVVRDLEIHHSPGGPCLAVAASGYITAINNWIHHAKSNGIAYHGFVHHTVTADNIIHDILANDGISIHDSRWGRVPGPVGSHHWVIDNMLLGSFKEDAIDVATEDKENGPAGQDIKIIGNRIHGARLAGIASQHQCRYTWVLGNTIVGCAWQGAKALSLGKATEGGHGWVVCSGNLLVDNPRSVRLRAKAQFVNNTVVHRAGGAAVTVYANADGMVVERNLILAHGATFVQIQDALKDAARVRCDHNWYGPMDTLRKIAAARFLYRGTHDFPGWRGTVGQDAGSTLKPVSGLNIAEKLATDVAAWDATFLTQFVPPANWEGHDQPGGTGAFGQDGERLGMPIQPFPSLKLNDGYGWAGNALVRERYPLPKLASEGHVRPPR